jgi:hypothetical protein
MKWSFRTTRILFACLAVAYLLPSCGGQDQNLYKMTPSPNLTIAEHNNLPHLTGDTIIIEGYVTPIDGTLILQDTLHDDATEVVCKRSQTIHWSVSIPHVQIKGIAPDNTAWIGNDGDFFKTKPSADNPQNWRVTLKDKNSKSNPGSAVHYYIEWFLDTDASTVYTYDPLMQLNPIK